MMMPEVMKMKARQWAMVQPTDGYGQSAVKWSCPVLKAAWPDVELAAEQSPALGRTDAGSTVQALSGSKPEGNFDITFGPDVTNLVGQRNTRGLVEGRSVVSVLTGEPKYPDPLGDETPTGWMVAGYPVGQVQIPVCRTSGAADRARFREAPKMRSVVGRTTIKSIEAIIKRSGGLETAQLEAGFRGAALDSPAAYRASDRQGTLGSFVSRLAVKDGGGLMTGWRYCDGFNVQPDDAEMRRLRPAA